MKDKLKAILESVDPNGEVFNEAAQDQFVNLIESRVNEKVETAVTEANEKHSDELQKLEESTQTRIDEALETQDAEYAEKLEQVLEHIDTDHSTKLEQVLEHIDTDHSEKLEQILEHIDTDHSEKLEQVLEHIDTDHAEKLEMVMEHVDTDYAEKLQEIVDLYEAKLEESSVEIDEEVKIDEALAENVSDFLNNFISESVEVADVVNEAKLEKLENMISEMRKVLVVTDDYVEQEITEAVLDAKDQIENSKQELNDALNENIQLNKQIKVLEAKQLLESKTSAFSDSKKLYVNKLFAGSTVEEITSKLDEAVKAYDNELNEKRRLIKEEKLKQVKDYYADETPVLKESVDPAMDQYINQIEKSYRP